MSIAQHQRANHYTESPGAANSPLLARWLLGAQLDAFILQALPPPPFSIPWAKHHYSYLHTNQRPAPDSREAEKSRKSRKERRTNTPKKEKERELLVFPHVEMMAVDEGRITVKSLWAYNAQRVSADRSSSPESAKSGASSAKAPRKRASKPKVRTGCLSCKRRHLKCDERKEGGCLRCETFGIPCEGYAPPKPVKETKPARVERPLLPRLKAAGIAPAPPALAPAPSITINAGAAPACSEPFSMRPSLPCAAAAAAAPPLLRAPSFIFDWEDEDNFYWSMFQHHIVKGLSPYFESTFWTRMSLREGISNDCIRHSILSIGASPPGHRGGEEESTRRSRRPRTSAGSTRVATSIITPPWTTTQRRSAICARRWDRR